PAVGLFLFLQPGLSREDIVVAGRGVVVLDDGEDIEGERPQVVVDAPADAWRAVGVVAGHRGSRQGQRRSGVVVSAARQAGPAAAAVGLVVGQEAAIHRRRGREHVSDAAARAETGEDSSGAAGRVTLAAAGLPVAQLAAADVGRASEIPYASAHPGPDQG